MNFFNLCCHSKSKKSLDYISDWIDKHSEDFKVLNNTVSSIDTWKTNLDSDIIQIVKDVASEYDYSENIPQLITLSNDIENIKTSLLNKVNIIVPNKANNIALLDSTGNLVDSGTSIISLTYKIENTENFEQCVLIEEDGTLEVTVPSIFLKGELAGNGGGVEISSSNFNNVRRAIQNPDSIPIQDSDKLITSGAVYKALELKTLALSDDDGSVPGFLEPFDEEEFSKLADSIDGKNDPTFVEVTLYIHVNGERVPLKTIGSVFRKSTQTNSDSYDEIFYLYINGYVLVRTGQTNYQETTWNQGFTKINVLSENS